ncbi:Fe-S-containing hydro-lyase [Erysipelotrichaceae bacterium OttesenSCG-928-M19]|nr:Fe-S-containing hydro-lyase [Erysipelotrichaceae bacterium OttesenSCG-928-M19]
MSKIQINTPLSKDTLQSLKAGDQVLLSGIIYTARDAAHARLIAALDNNETLPFDIKDQVIYYVGPTPTKPGQAFGSAGPTTSYRMDAYTPRLIEEGLVGMIGKGKRSQEVKDAMKGKAIYFAAVGGAAALMGKCVVSAEVIAYDDLGAEAIRKLEVKDLPIIVINDLLGNDLYLSGQAAYLESKGDK